MKSLDAYGMTLSGTHLVEASAGTGKTYTISTLFLRMVLERRLPVSQILVVTYTRAATAELRDRIRKRLKEALNVVEGHGEHPDAALNTYLQGRAAEREKDRARLSLAISGFDEAAISTIHGFCQRALSDSALESQTAFDVEFVEDERPLQRALAQDFWALETFAASEERLASLKKGSLSLDAVEQLVARVAGDAVPVIPETVPEPPTPDLQAWGHARDRVLHLWDVERAAVETLLSSPALKGQSYGDSPRRGLLELLDAVGMTAPGGFAADKLAKLCPQRMAELTKKGHVAPQHPLFDACAELFDLERAFVEASERLSLHVRRKVVDYARKERKRRTSEEGVQGFDDLLAQLAQGLTGSQRPALLHKLRSTYGAALIDEFQDTDPLQYQVFADVFAGEQRPLLLIGDPKQAIYGFRGADIFAYLQAAAAAGEQRHTLTTNYRSDPGMVAAVNSLFEHATAPFLFEDIVYPKVSAKAERDALQGGSDASLQFLANEEGEAMAPAVATEVVHLLQGPERIDGDAILPRHVAVLCRRNKEAREVHAALAERGVPCVLEGDSSVFDLPIAEELQRVMAAMAAPDDPRQVRAALATSLCGVTADALLSLETDDATWEAWVERFTEYHHTWQDVGFIQAFQRMIDGFSVARQLLSRRDGERRLTDLLHLSELLHAAATRQRLGPLSLLQWLSDMRADEDARSAVPESAQVRLESDAHVLRVTTVHKSKGLEYPIVFCPYLWAASGLFATEKATPRFHDAADAMLLKMDLGSEALSENREAAELESVAEGLRLLYVALTRAKHRTYVCVSQQRVTNPHLIPLHYLASGGGGVAKIGELEATKGNKGQAALARLRVAVEHMPEQVAIRPLAVPDDTRYSQAATRQDYVVRRCDPPDAHFALQSFSGLARGSHRTKSPMVEEGLDHDLGTGLVAGPDAAQEAPVTLAEFPGGARMGTLIHHVYEHLDFLQADEARVRTQVEASLAEFVEPVELAPPLSRAIHESLYTPLEAEEHGAVQLAMLDRSCRVDEMEFMLKAGGGEQRVDMARVREAFAAAGGELAQDYAERLGGLEADAFSGFLRGFIDLIYRHGDRYYLVDYKSNHLGTSYADYGPTALREAMIDSHYVLQYHLYTVALDRYLRLRQPGYRYAQHFGGVQYLFVRGMAPHARFGTGVFRDRPDEALVAALTAAVTGQGGDHA